MEELKHGFYVTINSKSQTVYFTHTKWNKLVKTHIAGMLKGKLLYVEDSMKPELGLG